MSAQSFFAWYAGECQANDCEVHEIPFAALNRWRFATDPYRLAHDSGRFFTIEGIRVRADNGRQLQWDQPIINQPDIGILGIITRVFDGVHHFLMQAKMEPGNVNGVQLAPTVQATRSNYTRVHGGKQPAYLEYFTQPGRARVLVDQLQSEQGSCFLRKRNRNMVVEVAEDIPLEPGFCWLTLGQTKRLLGVENLVSMDSRSVISCLPLVSPEWGQAHGGTGRRGTGREPGRIMVGPRALDGFARDVFLSLQGGWADRTQDELLTWVTRLKVAWEMTVERIPLDQVAGWRQTDREIAHESGKRFSVAAVDVRAPNREVTGWTQPILKYRACGVSGFLVQKINGTLHFLARAQLQPGGFDLLDVGPTVTWDGSEDPLGTGEPVYPLIDRTFLEHFVDPAPGRVRFSVVHSEEGGRFYHFQNRYMIVELPEGTLTDTPPDFAWMTLRQLAEFARYGWLNIEARNLIACVSLSEEDWA
jgi:oxidase EvaA